MKRPKLIRRRGASPVNFAVVLVVGVVAAGVVVFGVIPMYSYHPPAQSSSSTPSSEQTTSVPITSTSSAPPPFVIGKVNLRASDFYAFNSTTQFLQNSKTVLDCGSVGSYISYLPPWPKGYSYIGINATNRNLHLTIPVEKVSINYNGASTTFSDLSYSYTSGGYVYTTASPDCPNGQTTPFYVFFNHYPASYNNYYYFLINGGQPVKGVAFTGTVYLADGITLAFQGTFS